MTSPSEPRSPLAHGDSGGAPPELAHHFESLGHQRRTALLGMWVFLSTEILMFGGLFCAYAVYRANHPEVFAYAHEYLDTTLGAINTVILLTSSLTMAWAVRAAQLGRQRALVTCLALTLLGAAGFMVVKGIEYTHEWQAGHWVGSANRYHPGYSGADAAPSASPASGSENVAMSGAPAATPANAAPPEWPLPPDSPGLALATDRRNATPTAGVDEVTAVGDRTATGATEYTDLSPTARGRVHVFFQIYFLMTGLHGIHVLIGIGLITWLLVKASGGRFHPGYYTPVDCVGLYWHLVDLIWIYLFPLLYLIH